MNRIRQDNWSEEEKRTLSELMKQHVNIIEEKKNNLQTITKKKQAWENIYTSFVAEHGPKRDIHKLKDQWKRIKLEAKKDISRFKKYEHGTGGGPPAQEVPSELSWLVKDLLPHEFEKASNPYDDDENGNCMTADTRKHSTVDSHTHSVADNTTASSRTEVSTPTVERMEVESCTITIEQPHILHRKTPMLIEVIENNPPTKNMEIITSTKEGSAEVHPHMMEQPRLVHKKPQSKQPRRKESIRNQAEDRVSRYTKDFLELRKDRIMKQMQYDAEKHEEEMKLLKLQQIYWQKKVENNNT